MLSAKSRYAITSVVDIAINQSQKRCVSVAEIAKRQQISEKFLESILPLLRKSGILSSALGPGGGYKLAKRSDNILLINITNSVNQVLKVTRCKEEENCTQKAAKCITHDLWYLLEKRFKDLLGHITIEDVILGNLNKPYMQGLSQVDDSFIYMDNNATTKANTYAKEKINECMQHGYNPSSLHYQGQIASKIIEEARQNIKNLSLIHI